MATRADDIGLCSCVYQDANAISVGEGGTGEVDSDVIAGNYVEISPGTIDVDSGPVARDDIAFERVAHAIAVGADEIRLIARGDIYAGAVGEGSRASDIGADEVSGYAVAVRAGVYKKDPYTRVSGNEIALGSI